MTLVADSRPGADAPDRNRSPGAYIALKRATKHYGRVTALAGADFAVRPGEVIGVVGQNGAGKSTLMNVLSGAVQRWSGDFVLDGVPVAGWSGGQAQAKGLRCANLSAAEITRIVHGPLRGFVFQSLAFNLGGDATLKAPALLSWFTAVRFAGVHVMPVAVIALSLVIARLLRRHVWGRRLLATGQSEAAAELAGIEARRVRLGAYVFCGVTAALAGFLIAGFTGGATLNMGDVYLLESIAVVVLGGTSVAGGQANALGIWGAELFFNLMATMLNTFGIEVGVRLLLTGVLIILIVAAVPRPRTA